MDMIVPAAMIAIVGFLETIAVGGKMASEKRYSYDANQAHRPQLGCSRDFWGVMVLSIGSSWGYQVGLLSQLSIQGGVVLCFLS